MTTQIIYHTLPYNDNTDHTSPYHIMTTLIIYLTLPYNDNTDHTSPYHIMTTQIIYLTLPYNDNTDHTSPYHIMTTLIIYHTLPYNDNTDIHMHHQIQRSCYITILKTWSQTFQPHPFLYDMEILAIRHIQFKGNNCIIYDKFSQQFFFIVLLVLKPIMLWHTSIH